MLADQRLDVQVVYDEGEVTLRVPDLGVLGFGDTYEEAAEDLLSELEVYAASYFQNPARYAYTSRASHAGVLMRFAISSPDERRAMLSEAPVASPRLDEDPTFDEIEGFLRIDGWSQDRSTGHDFYEKVLPDGETLRSHTSFAGKKTVSPGASRPSSPTNSRCPRRSSGGASVEEAGQPPQPSAAAVSRVASELAERGASPRVRPERGGPRSPYGGRSSPAAYAAPLQAARLTGSGHEREPGLLRRAMSLRLQPPHG